MHRSIILLIWVLAVFGIAYWATYVGSAYRSDVNPQPHALIHHEQQELGTVRQGTMLGADFPMRNVGNHRLVVTPQMNGCCGEEPDMSPIIIEPEKSRFLRVDVDTRQWFGQLTHTERFTTNAPDLPSFGLTVSAVITSK